MGRARGGRRALWIAGLCASAIACNDVPDQYGSAGTGALPMAGAGASSGASAPLPTAGTGVVAGTGGVAGTSVVTGGMMAMPPIDMPTAGTVAGAAGMTGGAAGTMAMPPIDMPMEPEITGPVIAQDVSVGMIAPGGQQTVCTTAVLDNETEVKVKAVRGHISPGSHHFIVDRAPTDLPLQGLVPCVGLSGTDATRVLIAEKPETVFAMPERVAFTMRPHQSLTMELHYFNPTDAPLEIHAQIEFVLAEGEELVGLREASMVFTGNFSITLAPHAPGLSEFFQVLPGSPQMPVYVFAMTSHTHALGVRSTIERAPNMTTPGTLVHESLSWAEPPMDEYDPPLVFTGSDGVHLKCEYNNTTDNVVSFGTRVQDEMCFMWLYYYSDVAQ